MSAYRGLLRVDGRLVVYILLRRLRSLGRLVGVVNKSGAATGRRQALNCHGDGELVADTKIEVGAQGRRGVGLLLGAPAKSWKRASQHGRTNKSAKDHFPVADNNAWRVLDLHMRLERAEISRGPQ